MFDDKPFTLGKYEHTRIRVTIAELAANGGAPMGFYTRFTEPEARQGDRAVLPVPEAVRRDLSREPVARGGGARVPALKVAAGKIRLRSMNFASVGKELLDRHVLFDIVLRRAAAQGAARGISASRFGPLSQISGIRNFERRSRIGVKLSLSRFDAPAPSASPPADPPRADELDIHFVNYNRTEPPKNKDGTPSTGRGIKDEQPIESPPITCDVVLPTGFRRADDRGDHARIARPASRHAFTQTDGRVQFTSPNSLSIPSPESNWNQSEMHGQCNHEIHEDTKKRHEEQHASSHRTHATLTASFSVSSVSFRVFRGYSPLLPPSSRPGVALDRSRAPRRHSRLLLADGQAGDEEDRRATGACPVPAGRPSGTRGARAAFCRSPRRPTTTRRSRPSRSRFPSPASTSSGSATATGAKRPSGSRSRSSSPAGRPGPAATARSR